MVDPANEEKLNNHIRGPSQLKNNIIVKPCVLNHEVKFFSSYSLDVNVH